MTGERERGGRRKTHVPTLGIHKATGQARVVIQGRSYYLGAPGPEAEQVYRQLVAEWLQTGKPPRSPREEEPGPFTVADLVAAFLEAHETYYVGPDGRQTGELENYSGVFQVLLDRCAGLPAEEFSPRELKRTREAMISKGWCRKVINDQVRRLKRVVKWAVSEELISPTVYHGVQAVEGLRPFRSGARESTPVLPVPEADIEAVLPHLQPMAAALVQLQCLTGMRVSEALNMRWQEVDQRGAVWLYRPARHKTMYLGRERVVSLGPRAQEILRGFQSLDRQAYIFCPAKSEADRSQTRRTARKSRMTPSQRERDRRAKDRDRSRPPGEVYTVAAYRRAIHRACDKAGIPNWSPSRLRHNAAERIRREMGVETARAVLGHADIRTTQLYSDMDQAKANAAMIAMG